METVLIIFHIIICLLLIAIVLLQTGRGAEIGAAFGGASRTLFGATGATTVMGKVTTVIAVLFMATCLALTYYSGRPVTKSIMDKPAKEAPAHPVIPEAKPVQADLPANTSSKAEAPEKKAADSQQSVPVSGDSTGNVEDQQAQSVKTKQTGNAEK